LCYAQGLHFVRLAASRAAHVQVIERLSYLGQVFLASLLLEARFSGKPECVLSAVAGRVATFWKNRPLGEATGVAPWAGAAPQAAAEAGKAHVATPPRLQVPARAATPAPGALARAGSGATPTSAAPRPCQVFELVREMEATKLMLVGQRAREWGCLLTLNVPADDAVHVLQQSARIAWLHGALGAAA
jgi:hypothetical protein